MWIGHQRHHIRLRKHGPQAPDIIPPFSFVAASRSGSPHHFVILQWWQEFAIARPRYITERIEIIAVSGGFETITEQLAVALPLLDLGNQPEIVPRLHRHILHRRKASEIIQAAGYKLIAALGALRRRCDHKAGAKNIDRDVSVGTDPTALAVMAIPGLEMAAAA